MKYNWKKMEHFDYANITYLMYKLITSLRSHEDFSIRFAREVIFRHKECSANKVIKVDIVQAFSCDDVFGSAKHQKKATYGLG